MRTQQITGRESIWEYPRQPIIQSTYQRIQVVHANTLIADTTHALKVCENGHPPTYYIPPEDIRMDFLEPSERKTYCEWKGVAEYYDLYLKQDCIPEVAWCYPEPSRGYDSICDFLAFYPHRVESCLIDGEEALPEPRQFYGGWITSAIEGPFR